LSHARIARDLHAVLFDAVDLRLMELVGREEVSRRRCRSLPFRDEVTPDGRAV
jgi:hypothetical protein